MASISTFSFLVALLISAAVAAANSTQPTTTLIRKACNQTGFNLHDLCISSLSAEPNSANADLRQLNIIAVRIAADQASQTAAYFSAQQADVAAAGTVDPMFYQCVSDCTDLYVDVVEQLDTTTAAVDDKADKDALMWLEAAMADVISCEKGCGSAATAEFRRRNDDQKKLLNITLTFAKLLTVQKTL